MFFGSTANVEFKLDASLFVQKLYLRAFLSEVISKKVDTYRKKRFEKKIQIFLDHKEAASEIYVDIKFNVPSIIKKTCTCWLYWRKSR